MSAPDETPKRHTDAEEIDRLPEEIEQIERLPIDAPPCALVANLTLAAP